MSQVSRLATELAFVRGAALAAPVGFDVKLCRFERVRHAWYVLLLCCPVLVRHIGCRGAGCVKLTKAQSVHALEGLALPRASYSGEIALAGLRHLSSTLVAACQFFLRYCHSRQERVVH
jgi:hypothetical protein